MKVNFEMDYSSHEPYDKESVYQGVKWISDLLSIFTDALGVDKNDLSISASDIIEIIIDVQLEGKKFSAFHDMIHLPIAKIVSLYCYYFLRKRPIVVSEKEKHSSDINERFCVTLLFSGLSISLKDFSIKEKEYINYLLYMFRYGEFTKDSLYMIAKTLHVFTSKTGRTE